MSEALELKKATTLNDIVQQTAFTVQSIAESMGFISTKLKNHEERITNQEAKSDALETRMTNFEDNERLDLTQMRRLDAAKDERICFLLGIEREDGHVKASCMTVYKRYYGAFCKKCWGDARKYSRCGKPNSETKKKDYEEVKKYISEWEPEMKFNGLTGTDAYIEYLDEYRNS